MRNTALLAILAILAGGTFRPLAAQDAKPADKGANSGDAHEGPKVDPLPKGEIKVLKAIVMEVQGTAQARTDREAAWKDLKVSDALDPGTVIRTGRESHVALRVGVNATFLVERSSRVAIPEIVQNGDVLKTRVSMQLGRAEVRSASCSISSELLARSRQWVSRFVS
jgi:hypothetical protein